MRTVLRNLVQALEAGQPVVYCRLVETRGSTPQKAGAGMIVFADGSQVGTLGGGCVEAEVKRRALKNLVDGGPEIICFQLDNDYGWDDGLICGGRMQILVDPCRDEAAKQYIRTLAATLERGIGCCEVVAFDEEKSGLPATACWLADGEGNVLASCRTGSAESAASLPEVVAQNMPRLSDRPRPKAISGVAYFANLERCRLLIVGGGHVGQAVASWAADLDFDVWVVDDRDIYVTEERFPRAQRRVCGPIGEVLPQLEITPNTYCLIVTRGHNHDEEALYHLVNRGARYVGMIGSRRKIKLIFDDLRREGVSDEALAGVYAPLGIDIGSQTVPEIAVSILAELVAHRNLGGKVPGRPAAVVSIDACE